MDLTVREILHFIIHNMQLNWAVAIALSLMFILEITSLILVSPGSHKPHGWARIKPGIPLISIVCILFFLLIWSDLKDNEVNYVTFTVITMLPYIICALHNVYAATIGELSYRVNHFIDELWFGGWKKTRDGFLERGQGISMTIDNDIEYMYNIKETDDEYIKDIKRYWQEHHAPKREKYLEKEISEKEISVKEIPKEENDENS